MKTKLVASAIVLAALLMPGVSWAIWPSCVSCPSLAHGASCTCPGGPPYRFTTCDKYPLSCQPQPLVAGNPQSEKDAFLASLTAQSAATSSLSR